MADIANPHDKFFKEVLSRQEVARDFILREKGGDIMPTVAEKWIEQGIQQGIQQGILQGILQASRGALIEVLEDRFETVSQTLRNRLKEINDPDVLQSLHKKALHAGSLEEFKDGVQAALA
jgi:hypothetical protein